MTNSPRITPLKLYARPSLKLRGAGGLGTGAAQPGYRGNNTFIIPQGGQDLVQMGRKLGFCTHLAKISEAPQCDGLITCGVQRMDNSVDEQLRSESSADVLRFPSPAKPIRFDRQELGLILNLYGRFVAAGEWRDYAMDFGRDKATFSVFRRAAEQPLYRIVKDPTLARKQGQYAVVAQGGLILKRGQDLAQVLRVLMKTPKLSGA